MPKFSFPLPSAVEFCWTFRRAYLLFLSGTHILSRVVTSWMQISPCGFWMLVFPPLLCLKIAQYSSRYSWGNSRNFAIKDCVEAFNIPFLASTSRPDYFDEEAKCYGRLFEFCQVTFCLPDSGVAWLWQNFNNLLSILPPRQNNPVAAVYRLADDQRLSILGAKSFSLRSEWGQ